MSTQGLAVAVGYALTGHVLNVASTSGSGGLIAALSSVGWDRDAIELHAAERVSLGVEWPHVVPDHLRGTIGAAQLQAAIAHVRSELGLAGLAIQAPSRRRVLTEAEQRLLRDVPPHWGS